MEKLMVGRISGLFGPIENTVVRTIGAYLDLLRTQCEENKRPVWTY
jgi:hypothetical protein